MATLWTWSRGGNGNVEEVEMRGRWLVTGLAALLAPLLAAPAAGQDEALRPPGVPSAMGKFLDAWVRGSADETLSYFGKSEQAVRLAHHQLEPVPISSSRSVEAARVEELQPGYWGLMNSVWRSPRYDRETRTYERQNGAFNSPVSGQPMRLEHIESEIAAIFAEEFETEAVIGGGGRFLAFVANEATLITFTDEDATEILLGSRRPTLGMLVGIGSPEDIPKPGPFAAFWQQEGEEWRIQTIGGIQQ